MGGFDRAGQDSAERTRVASIDGNAAGPGKRTRAEQVAPAAPAIRVTASALNVRRAPSTSTGTVIGVVHSGKLITPVARQGDWFEIRHGGQRGFIYAAFTEPVRAAPPGASPTPSPAADHAAPPAHAPDAHAPAPHAPGPNEAPHAPTPHPPAPNEAPHAPMPHAPVEAHAPTPHAPGESPHLQPPAHAPVDAPHAPVPVDARHAPAPHVPAPHAPTPPAPAPAHAPTPPAPAPGPTPLPTPPAPAHGPTPPAPAHGPPTPTAAPPAPAGTGAPAPAAWAPPAGSALTDASLIQLAAAVRDPRMAGLLVHLGGVEKEAQLAKKQTGVGNEMEYTNAEHREGLVQGIAVVRGELEALDASDPHVAAFKIAAYHEIQRLAPYHFQKNIRAIESWDKKKENGGIRQWSTCNLTSLAMCLETVGITASSFPKAHLPLLEQTAKYFEVDINEGKDDQGGHYAGAVLTTKGKGTSLDKVMGFRLPDFLEIAAVVYATIDGGFAHDKNGIMGGGANAAVLNKSSIKFLKGLATFMTAKPTEVALTFDTDRKKNAKATDALRDFGLEHRGIYSDGVEKMNTQRNLMENAADKVAHASNDKDKQRYEKQRVKAEAYYQQLDKSQHRWLDDAAIEHAMPIESYKNTVTRQLAPHLDAGHGVIAGLAGHYVRLFSINADGVSVQDPGQWNRTEMRITWAEARAMGYFWTNLVISS